MVVGGPPDTPEGDSDGEDVDPGIAGPDSDVEGGGDGVGRVPAGGGAAAAAAAAAAADDDDDGNWALDARHNPQPVAENEYRIFVDVDGVRAVCSLGRLGVAVKLPLRVKLNGQQAPFQRHKLHEELDGCRHVTLGTCGDAQLGGWTAELYFPHMRVAGPFTGLAKPELRQLQVALRDAAQRVRVHAVAGPAGHIRADTCSRTRTHTRTRARRSNWNVQPTKRTSSKSCKTRLTLTWSWHTGLACSCGACFHSCWTRTGRSGATLRYAVGARRPAHLLARARAAGARVQS
jgi:hypothetical protein